MTHITGGFIDQSYSLVQDTHRNETLDTNRMMLVSTKSRKEHTIMSTTQSNFDTMRMNSTQMVIKDSIVKNPINEMSSSRRHHQQPDKGMELRPQNTDIM